MSFPSLYASRSSSGTGYADVVILSQWVFEPALLMQVWMRWRIRESICGDRLWRQSGIRVRYVWRRWQ